MRTRATLPIIVLLAASACTWILEENEAECWCGEQWQAQIAGAKSMSDFGEAWSIPASSTTVTVCVTQLEHLALDAANPQDPLYLALRSSLESAAVAKCEIEGASHWGANYDSTDCSMTGMTPVSTNLLRAGACWKSEDWDHDEFCPLFPECRPYYDCSSEAIWDGDDEAGGEVSWECEPVAFARGLFR